MAAITRPEAAGKIFELGGPKIMSFREILGWILAQIGRNRPLVAMPSAAAELMARIPFSGLTQDQLLMLSRDNVANPALPGLSDLGIVSTPIDLIVPGYLARYRKGGLRAAEQ
jgi:NADH dehydrogenase